MVLIFLEYVYLIIKLIYLCNVNCMLYTANPTTNMRKQRSRKILEEDISQHTLKLFIKTNELCLDKVL